MKTLMLAVSLLLIIIILTVMFSVFSDKAIGGLIEAAEAAADCTDINSRIEAAAALYKLWGKHSTCFSLGVHGSEIKKTDTLTHSLDELCKREHSDAEYYGVCRLIREQLLHIKEHNDISFKNIV